MSKKWLFLAMLLLLIAGCSRERVFCDYGECVNPEEIDVTDQLEGLNYTDDEPGLDAPRDIEPAGQDRTLPVVAIHVSEISREGWSRRGVPYFESYTALAEILGSHKILFDTLSDTDIENKLLLPDGTPAYPILFTLNNEIWTPEGVDAVRKYADAGGTVFFTYSTFTIPYRTMRTQDCFLIPELGLECEKDGLIENIVQTDTLQKRKEHPVVEHIPYGNLVWRMSRYLSTRYDNFWVHATRGEVLRSSKGENTVTTLAIIPYGNGTFIYNSQINPFWGRYQGEPGIHNALIALNSIEWAFKRLNVPRVHIRPWDAYDAAFTMRFDVETTREEFLELFPRYVETMERNNVTGIFYILVDQEQKGKPNPAEEYYRADEPAIAAMLRDARDRGMIVGSHSTWHIGPDFDKDEAVYNIDHSLDVLERVMGERTTDWVAPAFTANLDSSLQIIDALGIKVTGNQGIGYLPHFALSPTREGHHYGFLEVPTLDYYHPDALDGQQLATVLEHHKLTSIYETVDFYYRKNGIINLYAHMKEENLPRLQYLLTQVNRRENIWHPTPDELYIHWWDREHLHYENVSLTENELHVLVRNDLERDNTGILRVDYGNATLDVPLNISAYETQLVRVALR